VSQLGGEGGNRRRGDGMIRKPTLIMLVVFALLLLLAFLWPKLRPQETVSEVTPTSEPLWNVLISDIHNLKVENFEKGKTLEFKKNEEGLWMQILPTEGQADGELLEQTITWLTSPSVDREISSEGGLEQFGLIEPSGIITVTLMNGTSNVLSVGDVTPTGSMRYVKMPHSSRILLINKYDVNSILDMVDDDWLTPLPEETGASSTSTPIP